jgi:hypothetical protein
MFVSSTPSKYGQPESEWPASDVMSIRDQDECYISLEYLISLRLKTAIVLSDIMPYTSSHSRPLAPGSRSPRTVCTQSFQGFEKVP